jgi:hypothetical protein
VCARERFLQALDVVEVGFDYFGACGLERRCLVLVDVAGNGSRGETASGIRQNCAHEAAALRTRRAQYRNNFFICHVNSSVRCLGERREA